MARQQYTPEFKRRAVALLLESSGVLCAGKPLKYAMVTQLSAWRGLRI